MGKIDLKAYVKPVQRPVSPGEILRRARIDEEKRNLAKIDARVTEGIIDVHLVEAGYAWAITDYIKFTYAFMDKPTFTWGLEGTCPDAAGSSYVYSLPEVFDTLTATSWRPAVFVPRVVHWHMDGIFYMGCYLCVIQLDSETTEADKWCRIHYRFEGTGMGRT